MMTNDTPPKRSDSPLSAGVKPRAWMSGPEAAKGGQACAARPQEAECRTLQRNDSPPSTVHVPEHGCVAQRLTRDVM